MGGDGLVALVIGLAVAQALLMLVDELFFHRRRGLPRWERIGHPLDTATVAACYAWLVATTPAPNHALVYAALVVGSCLFVTKDEPLHATECSAGEHWVHSVLFTLHPAVLAGAGLLWWTHRGATLIAVQLALTIAFALYQTIYWQLHEGKAWQR